MKRKPHTFLGVKRIYGVYTLLVVLLLLLLSFTLIRESEDRFFDYVLLDTQKNCELIQTSCEQLASQIDDISTTLLYTPSIQGALQASGYAELAQLSQDISDTLSEKISFPSSVSLSLYSEFVRYSNLFLPDELQDMSEQLPDVRSPVFLGFQTPRSPLNNRTCLVIGYNYFVRNEKAGSLLFAADILSFVQDLPLVQQEGRYFVLADTQDELLFLDDTPPDASVQQSVADAIRLHTLGQADSSQSTQRQYVIQSFPVQALDCTLFAVVDKTILQVPFHNLYTLSGFFLLVLIVIIAVSGVVLHFAVVSPLHQLGARIAQLRSCPDPLAQPDIPSVAGCREICSIQNELNALLHDICYLTEENQKKSKTLHHAEILYKNSQIEQLCSQINPHFLYNSLELLRADAIAGRIDLVSSITTSMGKLYRYSIKGPRIVKLCQEIEIVQAYLHIQQNRFVGKITALYNIGQDAYDVKIPKMILQPLVENAIVHGIETRGEGIIFVSALLQSDTLVISVRDNGCGIPASQLTQLQEKLRCGEPPTDSIGIFNVNARLRLQYGDSFRFDISSSQQDGTCIELYIPVDTL